MTSGGGKKKNKKNKQQKCEEDAPKVEDIDVQIQKIKSDWEAEKEAMLNEKQ